MTRLSNLLIKIALVLVITISGGTALAAELYLVDIVLTDCDVVCIPIGVLDFSAVAGVEIHMTYDETCMTYDSISLGHLSGATINGGSGAVHIIWEDFENALTLADDTRLTHICFSTITAAPDAPCAIGFQSNCELVDEFGDPIPLVTTDGSVACDADPGCCVMRGDINHDGAELIDIADLVYIIDFMFRGGPAPVCFDEADIDASGTEPLDIGDLVYLIDFMFRGGPEPTPCP
ncbi:MAG: hypothetical protein OEV49_14585 [candidate division Zixibacteria bacterium]|nr:hypothetical protein [candidate division Zixibacteria bacterium]MDH4033933.1 hypothetical protein [candidate division Zixibacteria bacterium]